MKRLASICFAACANDDQSGANPGGGTGGSAGSSPSGGTGGSSAGSGGTAGSPATCSVADCKSGCCVPVWGTTDSLCMPYDAYCN